MSYRFNHEILIEKGRQEVSELFTNIENFPHWFRGTNEITKLSPDLTDIGAKFLIKGNDNGREWEGVISIENKEIPVSIKWLWNTDVINNRMVTRFITENDHQTRIICENKLDFIGLFGVFFTFRLPKLKAQFQNDLEQFKKFAESR